jgi:hypothetical protein
MFNSVLRRYTPPTCTLEITAKGSPLSQWSDRPVLRQLQFQLSFDDPKLPIDQQVKLQGDRAQLESLSEAVGSYVQTFLMQSATELESIDLESTTQNGDNGVLATIVRGARADLTQQESSFPDFEENQNQLLRLPVRKPVENTIHPVANAGIALKPRGLLAHELVLGTLATAESGSVISLSAVQLFDLANALDEYMAEVSTLPALSRPWFRSQQGMLSIAAATLLAFGVTGSLLKFVIDMNAPVQTATSPALTGLPDQQVAILPNSPQISGTKPPPPANFAPPNPLKLPPPPNATVFPNNSSGPTNQSIPRSSLPRQTLPPIVVAPAPRVAQTQIPIQPVSPENPSIAPRTNSQVSTGQSSADSQASTDSLQTDNLRNNGASGARLASPNTESTDSTAFDTIPQVAEARAYFQQRWQPPAGLNQTLEYRLRVGADGTIQQIIPLGQSAGDYIDRTQIPLVGEPFVSPLQAGNMAEIRLVLSPNGRVRTFLEAPN